MSYLWTRGEINQAEALLTDGVGLVEIAARLGRTLEGVQKKLRELELTPKVRGKWTPEMDAMLRRMAKEGHSASAAGKVLGITRNAAIGRAHRIGVHFQSNVNGRPPVAGPKLPKPRMAPPMLLRPAPPVAPEPIRIVRAEPVPFLDTQKRHCRWPVGDWDVPVEQKLCCGAQVIPGIAYCRDHFKLSCGPSADPAKRLRKLEAA
jgi:hypothetical protein